MLHSDTHANRWPERLKLSFLGTMLVMLLALVGCGGGGGTSAAPPPPSNPVPSITGLSPSSTTAGGTGFTLMVTGTSFVSSSVVEWNGGARTTSFVSSTQLSAAISANDIATPGTYPITVFNPSPGGGTSNAASFTVNNPVPVLTSISPTSAVAGQVAFSLTVTGTNFVSTSVVQFNGTALSTTFNSSTQLTAPVPASDATSVGTAQITVFNPSPGGGTSNAISLSIIATSAVKLLTTVLPATGGNKSYYFILSASGGAYPYTWSFPPQAQATGILLGALPTGLTLDSTSGLISGTVASSAAGTDFKFVVQVQDSLTTPQIAMQALNINVLANLPRNDNPPPCGSGSDVATAISNGRLRASISPFGDVDVYSFHGTAGNTVTIETFADRLNLFNDGVTDSYLDTFLELLDSSCTQIATSDDINPGVSVDSLIQNLTLPYTGSYYIRVRDLRGDGRPDLIYELSLSGAD